MKKMSSFIVAVLFLITITALPAQAASVPKAVEEAADNVVLVSCDTGTGEESGAGFVVSKQVWKADDEETDSKEDEEKKMYVVTTYDLVEANKKNLTVKWKKQEVTARAVGYFPTQNVAVLELDEVLKDIKILPIRKAEQKTDTKVYPVGYEYQTDDIKADLGKVTAKKKMVVTEGRDEITVYETSAEISKKNKGGPALDKSGYVVGLNFFNGNSGAIISESELTYFLDEKKVEYKTFQINIIFIIIPAICIFLAVLIFILLRKIGQKKNRQSAYLVGVQGEYGGSQFPISAGETIWLGRNSGECQIVFQNNKKISRRHCSLMYDAEQGYFILTDLNSRNGTWIEREKILPEEPAVLKSGEEFSVGGEENVFRVEMI